MNTNWVSDSIILALVCILLTLESKCVHLDGQWLSSEKNLSSVLACFLQKAFL